MKNYPPQFKADAVALYQSRPEAAIRQVTAGLGINPETLRDWGGAAGASRPRGHRAEVPTEPPTPLETKNAVLCQKTLCDDNDSSLPIVWLSTDNLSVDKYGLHPGCGSRDA
ncbi:transposase [Streptomyces sp. GESEQ-4]|uniref:transposase n=1 Tax=Streptomyces sp. GESEQ-4 TaxID=2812655 RepID=UPI001B341167|nr:transposase [Streptomyces sp. GESEQ-4]